MRRGMEMIMSWYFVKLSSTRPERRNVPPSWMTPIQRLRTTFSLVIMMKIMRLDETRWKTKELSTGCPKNNFLIEFRSLLHWSMSSLVQIITCVLEEKNNDLVASSAGCMHHHRWVQPNNFFLLEHVWIMKKKWFEPAKTLTSQASSWILSGTFLGHAVL